MSSMTKPFSLVLHGGPTRPPAVALKRMLSRVTVSPCAREKTSSKPSCCAIFAAEGDATTGMSFESFSSVGRCVWSSRP